MAFEVIHSEDGHVRIHFERSSEGNKLVDAIVVGPAQFEQWSKADIEEIIEARWLAYLESLKPRFDGLLVDDAGVPILDRNGFPIPIWKRDETGIPVVDEAGEPVVIEYQRDEAGDLVFGEDGKAVPVVEGAE